MSRIGKGQSELACSSIVILIVLPEILSQVLHELLRVIQSGEMASVCVVW